MSFIAARSKDITLKAFDVLMQPVTTGVKRADCQVRRQCRCPFYPSAMFQIIVSDSLQNVTLSANRVSTSTMRVPLMRLDCGCNSYEWVSIASRCIRSMTDHFQGKVGKDSAAAKFAAATNFSIEDDKPYAEVCKLRALGYDTLLTRHTRSCGWARTPHYPQKMSRHNDRYWSL